MCCASVTLDSSSRTYAASMSFVKKVYNQVFNNFVKAIKMAVTLVKSILSAYAIITSIIENPSVYAGCVFKIRRIFALSFNGTDADKLK